MKDRGESLSISISRLLPIFLFSSLLSFKQKYVKLRAVLSKIRG